MIGCKQIAAYVSNHFHLPVFPTGITCEVLCIDGICAPKGTCFDENLTACQSICGFDSCDDAKEATPCDMTKFNYDGKYGFCYGEILMYMLKFGPR